MRFFTSILAGAAALASLVNAQDSLGFTNGFSSVTAGQSQTITYSAPDTSVPVTITLRKGNPLNLDTVSVLTSDATGGSYTWTPDSSLVDGSDYALEITQGNQINYSGQFGLTGGSAASSSAASSSAASTTASASASTQSASTTASASTANITSSILSISSSIAASLNSSISSVTASAHNATSTLATETKSASGSSSAASSASRTGSSTASGSSSAPTSGAGELKAHSPLALIFGAVVAMVYLH